MDEEPVTSRKLERSYDRFVEMAQIMLVFSFFSFSLFCNDLSFVKSDVISFLALVNNYFNTTVGMRQML